MTKNWKIGLSIVAGLFLLLVLAGGVLLYVASRAFPDDPDGRKPINDIAGESIDEGERFGKSQDNSGCLEEALSRLKKVESVNKYRDPFVRELYVLTKTLPFLTACLRNSRPTPAFCESVPVGTDIDQSKIWADKKCAEAGQSGQNCEKLFSIVQEHCQMLKMTGPKETNK